MKTESKKLDKCQVELTVTLDAEEMKASVKDVERAFVREARLPGFRPGKVPVELIRKEFAQGGDLALVQTLLVLVTLVDIQRLELCQRAGLHAHLLHCGTAGRKRQLSGLSRRCRCVV